jgi:hypothetical protein
MPTAFTRGAASALALGWARITAVLDPYFKYVTMLLPGNGTNGAQNNTFLDSSTNALALTRNGNTTQGTFSPYNANWGTYFNGSSYITSPSNAVLAPGTGDFTVECWVNIQTLPASGAITPIFQNDSGLSSTNDKFWFGVYNNAGTYQLYLGRHATSTNSTVNWTPSVNVWYHIAIERQSGTTLMFINGVQQTVTNSTAMNGISFGQNGVMAGAISTPYYLTGYISNMRYIVGAALYTSSFTPSTTPLTTTSQGASASQVKWLVCQSNRFIDNSTNAFAVTGTGNPRIQDFSPFSPPAPYSITTNGGGAYFDGNGDNIQVTTATAAVVVTGGAFTVEAWAYNLNTGGSFYMVVSQDNGSSTGQTFQFRVNANKLELVYFTTSARSSAVTVTSTATVPLNCWNHLAVSWGGANTPIRLFINGNLDTTTGNVAAIYAPATISTAIGSQILASPAAGYWTGYISDARILKGTQLYTATFTPPTSPLTAIANTALLCSMTNGAVIDNAMINELETVGNAQISTAQSKFGGSSIYFDGNGDYLFAPDNPAYDFGSGDFTIEFWIYRAATGDFMPIEKTINGQFGSWYIQFTTATNVISWNCSSTGASNNMFNNVSFGTLPSLSTWYHVAVVRNGSTFTGYINGTGTSIGTSTATIFKSTYGITVGAHNGSASFYLNGYMDDIRLTRGVARYTANFTPPTAPFPVQ